jgi:hypothetical protein
MKEQSRAIEWQSLRLYQNRSDLPRYLVPSTRTGQAIPGPLNVERQRRITARGKDDIGTRNDMRGALGTTEKISERRGHPHTNPKQ